MMKHQKNHTKLEGVEEIYCKFLKAYGPQGWWPLSKGKISTKHHNGPPENDKDRFEIIVGAILTQNTSWKNVEKAIESLNKNNAISPEKILKIRNEKLAKLIKSAGYYNQKAKKLKEIAKFHIPLKGKTPSREQLLKIWGVGPETADSILLYAYNLPIFVVDAYTKRIFSRLGAVKNNNARDNKKENNKENNKNKENDKEDNYNDYDAVQKLFMQNLPHDAEVFKEYHALIVEHGKRHCKVKAECGKCPVLCICKKSNRLYSE